MTRLIILAALAASLAGCDRLPNPGGLLFDRVQPSEPLPFKARLGGERGAAQFSVSVVQGGAGLDAVRESVRFPATNYCLRAFGSSRIDWVSAAGDPEAWIGRPLGDGTMVYSGRCDPR